MASDHSHGTSDLKVGLTGLGLGLVWVLIVSVIAYFLAAGG